MGKHLGGIAIAFAGSLILASSLQAQADQIYENWNTLACGFTSKAGFPLSEPMRLTSVELWYHWEPSESAVPYALFHSGRLVKEGRLVRAGCDPYQEAWCGARGNIDVALPPGRVMIEVERGRLCQNGASSGRGFIRAYGIPD
jgi:hypothetical protein